MLLQINKSPRRFMLVRTTIVYRTASASIYHAMCQYCWLSMLCGAISWHTFSLLMTVEERHGVSEHQRKPGTSLHCTRACTSANWFSPAGTCPRQQTTNASVNRTVKSAYALTCSVTRSQLSICRMTWYKLHQKPTAEHQRASSRDVPAQKSELWWSCVPLRANRGSKSVFRMCYY